MYKQWIAVALISTLSISALAATQEEQRVKQAGNAIRFVLDLPRTIPKSLLDQAACVVVFPAGPGNSLWGPSSSETASDRSTSGPGQSVPSPGNILSRGNTIHAFGVMTCRTDDFRGNWGAPVMMELEGRTPTVKIQIDNLLLLLMNRRIASNILSNKMELGGPGDGSEGAGLIQDRGTPIKVSLLHPVDVLTYGSAGNALAPRVSVSTDSLVRDDGANKKLYGKKVSTKEIVLKGAVPAPDAASELIEALNKVSPKSMSND
jgi:lipid-binding SYLF domain-containing protein